MSINLSTCDIASSVLTIHFVIHTILDYDWQIEDNQQF